MTVHDNELGLAVGRLLNLPTGSVLAGSIGGDLGVTVDSVLLAVGPVLLRPVGGELVTAAANGRGLCLAVGGTRRQRLLQDGTQVLEPVAEVEQNAVDLVLVAEAAVDAEAEAQVDAVGVGDGDDVDVVHGDVGDRHPVEGRVDGAGGALVRLAVEVAELDALVVVVAAAVRVHVEVLVGYVAAEVVDGGGPVGAVVADVVEAERLEGKAVKILLLDPAEEVPRTGGSGGSGGGGVVVVEGDSDGHGVGARADDVLAAEREALAAGDDAAKDNVPRTHEMAEHEGAGGGEDGGRGDTLGVGMVRRLDDLLGQPRAFGAILVPVSALLHAVHDGHGGPLQDGPPELVALLARAHHVLDEAGERGRRRQALADVEDVQGAQEVLEAEAVVDGVVHAENHSHGGGRSLAAAAVFLRLVGREDGDAQHGVSETERIAGVGVDEGAGRACQVAVVDVEDLVVEDDLVELPGRGEEDGAEDVEVLDEGGCGLRDPAGVGVGGEVDDEEGRDARLARGAVLGEDLLRPQGRVRVLDRAVGRVQLRGELPLDEGLGVFLREELEGLGVDQAGRAAVAAGSALEHGVEDLVGEVDGRRVVEDVLDGHVYVEAAADAGGELGRHEGLASEVEEVVGDAGLDAEDVGELVAQRGLDLVGRLHALRRRLADGGGLGLARQLAAVDLAVGVDGHLVEGDDLGRDHVGWEERLQLLADLGLDLAALEPLERAVREEVGRAALVLGGEPDEDARVVVGAEPVEDGVDAAVLGPLPGPAELDAEAGLLGDLGEVQGREGRDLVGGGGHLGDPGRTVDAVLGLVVFVQGSDEESLEHGFAVGDVSNGDGGGGGGGLVDVVKSVTVHRRCLEVDPRFRFDLVNDLRRLLLASDVNNGGVPVPAELVGGLHPLGKDFDVPDVLGQLVEKGREEGRVDQQLLLVLLELRDLLAHAVLADGGGLAQRLQGAAGQEALVDGVGAHVAEEETLDARQPDEGPDHVEEVVGRREVLGHRVGDHHLAHVCRGADEDLGLPRERRDGLDAVVHKGGGRGGRLETDVGLEPRAQVEEDHAGTRSDFEHAAGRLSVEHGDHALVEPLLHLGRLDQRAVVHGGPAQEVVADDGAVDVGLEIRVRADLEVRAPALNLLAGLVLDGLVGADGDEADHLLVRAVASDDDGCVPDDRVPEHRELHLGRLDTVAADLGLLVDAPEELDLPVRRPVSGPVTRPVGPHELALDGDVQEAVDIEGRVGVPAGESIAGDDQLAHDADGNQLLPGVHDVRPRAAHGLTDGHAVLEGVARLDLVDGTGHAVLCGTVGIVDARLHEGLGVPRVRRVQAVAADVEDLEGGQRVGDVGDALLEERGREHGHADVLTREHGLEGSAVEGSEVVDADKRRAVEQGGAEASNATLDTWEMVVASGSSRTMLLFLTRRTMPRCSTMTPLGLPVEPEVKMTYARFVGDGRETLAGASDEAGRNAARASEMGTKLMAGRRTLGVATSAPRSTSSRHGREDGLEPGGRHVDVEREVCEARLQDGHEGDGRLTRARGEHADDGLGRHVLLAEPGGQAVRLLIELAVCEGRGGVLDGDALGMGDDLLEEDVDDAGIAGVVGPLDVEEAHGPQGRQPVREGQVGDGHVGLGEAALEDLLEDVDHAADGGRVEEVGGIQHVAAEEPFLLEEMELEVEAGGDGRRKGFAGEALEFDAAQVLLGMDGEHELGQRVPRRVSRAREEGRDDPLEGDVLVLKGGRGRGPHLLDEAVEGLVFDDDPHALRVDEEADELLEFGPVAVGHGGSDGGVLGARQTVMGGAERRQKNGKGRDLARSTGPFDLDLDGAGLAGQHGRARFVAEELRGGAVGQLPGPVLQLSLVLGGLRLLPDGEVAVLDGERGHLVEGIVASQRRGVKGGELAAQDVDGPTI
ncbi:linear gramicidin synthetase subunit D [Colletotrichum higginsianum]|nr:linear gramicidin synthetase subunit D [Colletotrichum higginsianum]